MGEIRDLFFFAPASDVEIGRRPLNIFNTFGQEHVEEHVKLHGGQEKPRGS